MSPKHQNFSELRVSDATVAQETQSMWSAQSFARMHNTKVPDEELPKTISPELIDQQQYPAVAFEVSVFTRWLKAHSAQIIDAAMRHGAVRFRGFPAKDPQTFDQVRQALPFAPIVYLGGAAVRKVVYGEHLFTTNESPPSEPVPFHHELSQTIKPPDYIAFFCEQAAQTGGETPLVDSRRVYRFVADHFPEFTDKLSRLGVKYVRILPPEDDEGSAIGRSWRSTWQTDDPVLAEEKMRAQGMDWAWLPNGNLKTTTRAIPALRVDARTNQTVFFNSMIAAFKGWVDSRNNPRFAVRFGNDEALDCAILEAIYEYMLTIQVALPWQVGDILFIDNWVTMHARNPFQGPRKILAAIGERATH